MSLPFLRRLWRCRRSSPPRLLSPFVTAAADEAIVETRGHARELSHEAASTSARRWVGHLSCSPRFCPPHALSNKRTVRQAYSAFASSSDDNDESAQLIRLSESMVEIMRSKSERHKSLEGKLSGNDAASIDASEMGMMTQVRGYSLIFSTLWMQMTRY